MDIIRQIFDMVFSTAYVVFIIILCSIVDKLLCGIEYHIMWWGSWVLGNKGYSDDDLVKKMVKFQDNVSKFIIRLEVIEEVEEVKEETSIEVSLVEEVENLTDDLFQDEDLAYCEEVIKRETNNIKGERNMTDKEKKYLDYIDERVYHCLKRGIDKNQIAEWLDDVIYDLSDDNSSELFNILYRIQDNLLFGNEMNNEF